MNKEMHCIHFDGSICVNIIGTNYGKECDYPKANDCYKKEGD